MCDPISMTVAAVASTAVSSYGSYKAGQTAKANAKMEAANSKQQARIADFNADQALAYGDLNAAQTMALAGINTKLNSSIADLNVQIATATSDFNIGIHEGNAGLYEAQGKGDATLHMVNARAAEQNARITLENGNKAETVSRGKYAQLKSTQRVALAASGVALDEGSALRLQSDTEYLSQMDANTIKVNTIREAFGYRVDAANERSAAVMSELNGRAKAQTERGEALAQRLSSEVSIANTKMTSTFQILQEEANAQITASNIKSQAQSDAFNSKVQGIGFTSQAAISRNTAAGINPGLMAAGTLLDGASKVAASWYSYKKAA